MKRFTFYRLSARVVKHIFSKNCNKKPMLGAYFEDQDEIETGRGEKLQTIVPLQNHETVHAIGAPAQQAWEALRAAGVGFRMRKQATGIDDRMTRTAVGTANLS